MRQDVLAADLVDRDRYQRQHEAFDRYPFHSNRREEYVQNARQNDQINSSTTIPTTPGTGSRPQLASILREGRKSANIHLSSGVIWESRTKGQYRSSPEAISCEASHRGADG
jgi:hypothetical protein